jgi:hypothetical protein
MRLFISSTTAVAVSTSFLVQTNSAIAEKASLRLANDINNQYASAIGMECNNLPASSSLAANATITDRSDVGILTCDAYSTCVQDETSYHGGRCVASSTSRDLQCAAKCTGKLACNGLSQAFIDNYIGCGSCNGPYACDGVDRKSYYHVSRYF